MLKSNTSSLRIMHHKGNHLFMPTKSFACLTDASTLLIFAHIQCKECRVKLYKREDLNYSFKILMITFSSV